MVLLKRNLKDMEYMPYEGESDIDAETGRHTGEPLPTYGDPIPFKGNISTPSGYVNPTFYGEDIRYTHTLAVDPKDAPAMSEHGQVRYLNEIYEVRAVRPSLNYLVVALRKQTVNHADGDEP